MKDCVVVASKHELEQALNDKVSRIIVTDAKLASKIKAVKMASKVAIATAIGSIGVATFNFWNPIGLGAGVVGFVAGGSSMSAIIALGLGSALIYALYNGYSIKGAGKVTAPDGSTIEAEIILEKSK